MQELGLGNGGSSHLNGKWRRSPAASAASARREPTPPPPPAEKGPRRMEINYAIIWLHISLKSRAARCGWLSVVSRKCVPSLEAGNNNSKIAGNGIITVRVRGAHHYYYILLSVCH